MYSKVLITCVTLILSITKSQQLLDEQMNNLNSQGDGETVVGAQPPLVLEKQVKFYSKSNECLNRIYNALELEHNTCQKCGVEPKKDRLENLTSLTWLQLRCILIENIASFICEKELEAQVQNYINSGNSVCTGLQTLNSTSQNEKMTEDLQKIVALWKEDATHCGSVCYKNPKHDAYAVCSFLFGYYLAMNESKKPVVKNEVKNEEKGDAGEKAVQNSENLQKNNESAPIKIADDAASLETKKKDVEQTRPVGSKGAGNNVEDSDNPADPPEDGADEKASDPENKDKQSNNAEESPPPKVVPKKTLPSPMIMDNEESHAFSYFFLISGICIAFYLMMYNKKKILALIVEGRKRNVKRRPNSAAYSKLDCNLEEAMASGPSTSTSNTLLY